MTEQSKSPFRHPWWSPFSNDAPNPKTADEWAVIDIANMIKDKPDWATKFKDDAIVNKWIGEIKQQLAAKSTTVDNLIDLVVKELQWTIKTQLEISPFKVSIDDRIIFSDASISEKLKLDFIDQVDELKTSFEELDYHPGSDKQVVDLVHPSLYPLQYGVTPVVTKNGIEVCKYDEKVVKVKNVSDFGLSERYQWLPSIFQYNRGKFEIKSYINNLHPIKYEPLYRTIERIFNLVLPGLNYVLSRFASKEYVRISWDDYDTYTEEYHDLERKIWDNENDEDEDEKWDELQKTKLKYLKPPKIETEKPENDVSIDLKSFGKIKVITKLADIQLTPANPVYNGGSWHVEGTINEDIVATIIYYYDTENITDSSLSFRVGFDDPPYEQGDTVFCEEIYGVKDEQQMTRDIGTLKTTKDRVIIFPNACQHHVDPFCLEDKTRTGHRRILAFFIVDPYNKAVVATDDVPIQQEEWWNDGTNILPHEVMDKIKSLNANLPQSLEQTKDVRKELMEERSAKDDHDPYEHPYKREFSLCEH